jgi:hypothetical protein
LRVLEDYEHDHVSGGLDEEPGFVADPFVIPDGYTVDNISGYYLTQDLATGTWTVEFVFEADFGPNGYSDGGGDGGGGFHVEEPIGGALAVDGGGFGPMMAGGSKTTVTTTVTKTTSPSWSIQWNWYGPTIRINSGSHETTTTTTTTQTRAGRLTNTGEQGSLPPPK